MDEQIFITELEAAIQAGLALEKSGTEDQAIEHFKKLAKQYPNHPRVLFEYAGAYDYAGYEAEAIPLYQAAMATGLSGDELPRAYLQLGSSLRNVNQHEEAVKILTEGCQRFPDHHALRVFRALALHSHAQPAAALYEILDLLLKLVDSDQLDGYGRAIRQYADDLTNGTDADL